MMVLATEMEFGLLDGGYDAEQADWFCGITLNICKAGRTYSLDRCHCTPSQNKMSSISK